MSRPLRGQEKLPPADELRPMVRAHGSYAAVARAFGVSRQSVAAKTGAMSPGRRLGLLTCAICGHDGLETRVIRFGLQATTSGPASHNRYSGAIDLCQGCWSKLRSRRAVVTPSEPPKVYMCRFCHGTGELEWLGKHDCPVDPVTSRLGLETA